MNAGWYTFPAKEFIAMVIVTLLDKRESVFEKCCDKDTYRKIKWIELNVIFGKEGTWQVIHAVANAIPGSYRMNLLKQDNLYYRYFAK